MFGSKNEARPIRNTDAELEALRHEHKLKVAELESAHRLALKEKAFELNHFKDEEVKELREQIASKVTEIAVLEKENEMLVKITNINADLIDIKDLVSKLIDKLPEINLNSLTINGSK